MTDEEAALIEDFYRKHKRSFVLYADDGSEIADVPDDKVEEVAARCRRSRTGFVKMIWMTPDGQRAETPRPVP